MTPQEVSDITFRQFLGSIYVQTALKMAPAVLVGLFGAFGAVWWEVAGATSKQLAETQKQVQQLVLAQNGTALNLADLKRSTDDAFKDTQSQIADVRVDIRVVRGILTEMQQQHQQEVSQLIPGPGWVPPVRQR